MGGPNYLGPDTYETRLTEVTEQIKQMKLHII